MARLWNKMWCNRTPRVNIVCITRVHNKRITNCRLFQAGFARHRRFLPNLINRSNSLRKIPCFLSMRRKAKSRFILLLTTITIMVKMTPILTIILCHGQSSRTDRTTMTRSPVKSDASMRSVKISTKSWSNRRKVASFSTNSQIGCSKESAWNKKDLRLAGKNRRKKVLR